jgi:hypothetical protein
MILRTFKQLAQGFGDVPAQVVVQIDGNTVFSGAVTTLDQPMPSLPNSEYTLDNVAWTWQNDAEFSGSQSITVSVSDSPLILATTMANDPYNNVEGYGGFYLHEVGNVSYADPFTDVTIDGVAQPVVNDPDWAGQIWWAIPAGSIFAATMHVDNSYLFYAP